MDTPAYTASITIGGSSQTTSSGKGSVLPNTIITKQSGTLVVTALDSGGSAFDLSSLTDTTAYVKPYNTATTPVSLGTGVISGASNNIYTITWTSETIPEGWSSFAQDRDGAIVLYITMDETGTADYFQWSTRFNVEDGDFTGDASTLPLVSLIFYYNPTYEYSSTTTDADPGTGKFRLNNATLASVTEMYIADENKSSVDYQTFWQSLSSGDDIYMANPNTAADAAYFTVSGAPTDNTGYTTVPVTYVDAGTSSFTDGTFMSFTAQKTGLGNVVEDTTPQLGGDLDCNGNNIIIDDTNNIQDDSNNEYIIFSKTASAVNELTVANAATGNNPSIQPTGDDTNIGLELGSKGAANVISNDTMQWQKGADVASTAALPVLNDGNYFDVTGTTTITSIGALGVGTVIRLHFDAALTLTHNATDLVLPGAANITTAAGDEFTFVEYAAGDWRCTAYALASGEAIVGGAGGGGDVFGETTVNTHAGTETILASEWDEGGSGNGTCTVMNSYTDTSDGTVNITDSTSLAAGDKCYLANHSSNGSAVTWEFANASDKFNRNSSITSITQNIGDAPVLVIYEGSNNFRAE